jgi:hypothetical protein
VPVACPKTGIGNLSPMVPSVQLRPRIRPDDPAPGAHQERPEARHRHVIRPAVDGEHGAVVAKPAVQRQRAHPRGAKMPSEA